MTVAIDALLLPADDVPKVQADLEVEVNWAGNVDFELAAAAAAFLRVDHPVSVALKLVHAHAHGHCYRVHSRAYVGAE